MFCPVQKAMDLLSLRLLFILMASSFGLARLLRGSGSQYFNSSVATFKEMAVLLLTQDRATSIPKLLPHGYPCSWSTFSIILVKAKGVEATDANSCCVASCQESPENRLLVASFFLVFLCFWGQLQSHLALKSTHSTPSQTCCWIVSDGCWNHRATVSLIFFVLYHQYSHRFAANSTLTSLAPTWPNIASTCSTGPNLALNPV